jgi:hypothetical protein
MRDWQLSLRPWTRSPSLRAAYSLCQPSPIPGHYGPGTGRLFLRAPATTLGRFEEADVFLIRSADICARGQMAFADAWTRFARGHLLVARGELTVWTEARAHLEAARDSACLHGYGYLTLRAETELAQLT